MEQYYDWIKAVHLIAVISWMAGMLYLPRLFVYHCDVTPGSPEDKIFIIMEKRLIKIIMNPAMIVTIILGLILMKIYGLGNLGVWFHMKMLLVIFMSGAHGFFAICHKQFARGMNFYPQKFYRIANEVPTILMIFIVILVIVKPFE